MKYCNHIPSVIKNAHISFFIAENSEEYGKMCIRDRCKHSVDYDLGKRMEG